MATATLSSKYQLVIPKAIRMETGLKKGEKLMIIVKGGIISLVPQHLLSKMKGILKGMDTSGLRDERDRL